MKVYPKSQAPPASSAC